MCSQWQYPFSKATVSQCSFWNQGEKMWWKISAYEKKKKPPLFSIFQVTELCSAICRAWLNDVGDWRLCQGDVVPQSKKTGAALTFRAQSKPFLLWFPFEQSACLFLFPWKGLSWGAYCMQGIEELFWSEFVMLWERVCSLVAQTPPV